MKFINEKGYDSDYETDNIDKYCHIYKNKIKKFRKFKNIKNINKVKLLTELLSSFTIN